MTRLEVVRRTVVVEPDDVGVLAMFETGEIRWYATPKAAQRAIKARDRRTSGDIVVTELVWQRFPAGFVPPGETEPRTSSD